MKTRSASSGKAKATGPEKYARTAGNQESSEAYECPREQMIAEAAYFRAEHRGFEPGNEMSDWLQAESDVEGILRSLH
ncbi:MAG: DUF2934 domain-containing protein [Sulfuritalea sp.]|nr:DUF2934 domain-containing protein [Sulfuritalea sp.]MDP1982234.1 DUF2934 domain-containing protein [Sulfuritalea sp.]